MADIKDPENTILMELKSGTVVIELMLSLIHISEPTRPY